ncbi:MAG: hypothetical protein LBU51_10490 [Bacteroidales bacterium]|nr:hypothetical protein [Bacteroidales bacterium]
MITSNGCPTCKTSLLSYLQTQTNHVTLIVTQDWDIKLPDNVDVLLDEEAFINRLDMKISGTYALFIKNGKIVKTFSINPSNISYLNERIDIFFKSGNQL